MKKIIMVALLAAAALYGCQKEEPKQQFTPPIGQLPPGGLGGPMQGVDTAKLLQEEVTKDPKNLKAWIDLGNVMMDTHRYAEAIESYTKALELDPKNPNVRTDMGTCYRNVGKPDVAVREYKKAIEYDPNHVNAHKNMGVVLKNDLHDNKGALAAFEKAIALAPNAPDAEAIRNEISQLKAASK